MKKILLLFSVCALGVAGGAFAVDITNGPYQADIQGTNAFDCFGNISWQQLPNGANALASQDDQCYPFLAETADDFTGGGAGVFGVGWWGTGPVGGEVDYFRIEYFADGGGCPGELLASFDCPDYNETIGSPNGYCCNHDTFTEVYGVRYYLSVVAVFCFPPQFFWSTGDADLGSAGEVCFRSAFFGFPNWVPGNQVFGVVYDAAFILYTDGIGTPTRGTSWSAIKDLYR